jgi:hypothetical protein
MALKPCKHLDYESEFLHCVLKQIEEVRYWERDPIIHEGLPTHVQFCRLRGRINEIVACYNPGEKHCYEEKTDEDSNLPTM